MPVFLHTILKKAIQNLISPIAKKILPSRFALDPLKVRCLFWVHGFSKILSNVFKRQDIELSV